MLGFIGRLDYQKGADLVLGVAPWMLAQDVQLVCLGTGDPSLEVLPASCKHLLASDYLPPRVPCLPREYHVWQPIWKFECDDCGCYLILFSGKISVLCHRD